MVWAVDVMGWWAGGDGMDKWVWGREGCKVMVV